MYVCMYVCITCMYCRFVMLLLDFSSSKSFDQSDLKNIWCDWSKDQLVESAQNWAACVNAAVKGIFFRKKKQKHWSSSMFCKQTNQIQFSGRVATPVTPLLQKDSEEIKRKKQTSKQPFKFQSLRAFKKKCYPSITMYTENRLDVPADFRSLWQYSFDNKVAVFIRI